MNLKKTRLSFSFMAALLLVPPAMAQSNSISCAPLVDTAFVDIPVLAADDATGILRGTLYTVSEQVRMTTAVGGVGNTPVCYPQWVRAYRMTPPSSWNPAASAPLTEPMPGPTLRARVGGMIELTFLNVIDPNKFPKADTGCEQTSRGGKSLYPGVKVDPTPTTAGTLPDTYPDCFAGSVFTNAHYHGTHTNPNTTGDNVFINIRPSPRKHDGTNAPEITEATVAPSFNEFYAACEAKLLNAGPVIWPRVWSDLPAAIQSTLMDPVKAYPEWYKSNQQLIANGHWPQYYVGAYPYCFKLPAATTATTGAIQPATQTPHTHGAGSAEVDEAQAPERPVLMGQTPGTHWYHAHKHGSTTINVSNGMTGVAVIEGQYDDDINKTYGANWTRSSATKVLVINQLATSNGLLNGTGGGPGPDFSVNGRIRPTIRMAGNSVQMWRIANTSSRAGVYFQAPSGLQWKQLAQDGVQYTAENYWKNSNQPLQLTSGNRADLLVKAPAFKSARNADNTYDVVVYNTIDPSDRPPAKPGATPLTLLRVEVTKDGPNMEFLTQDQAPKQPSFLEDIDDDEISGTKIIKFASTKVPAPPGGNFPVQHTIDGKKFDGEVGVVVALNHAEEWKIVNETYGPATSNQISHPFHIHINPFQISEIFDPNAVLSSRQGPGTVTIAAGTPTVTGSEGLDFRTEFQVGDFISIANVTPVMPPGVVQAIAADGKSMTLNVNAPAQPATGTFVPVTNVPYTASIPLYTIDKANARAGQCAIDATKPETWKPCTPTEPAVGTGRIWWDVFPIPSGSTFFSGATSTNIPGYFKMRSRFVDYSGYYVIHCHILAHEDRGMMTVVEVAPLQTPYSHH